VSPLHICAERGFAECAKILVQKTPDMVKAVDKAGNTPLHVACDWDQIEVIRVICESSDDPIVITLLNHDKKTPVEVAYESNTQ
jgi:ankyrin repeat protein